MKNITVVCLSLMLLLTACGGASSGSPDQHSETNTAESSTPDTQSNTSYSFLKGTFVGKQIIHSAITGVSYPVDVYLPPDYHASDKHYAIIYVTDGQIIFPGLPYLLEDENVEAILVAISEGPENRRSKDYLLPGARDYFNFLTAELIPLIESEYRVKEGSRSLAGTSFGGVFSIVAMLMDDVSSPYFSNIMAYDASLYRHREETGQLLEARYMASRELNVNLVLTSAIPVGNGEYIDDFISDLENYQFTGLNIIYNSYPISHEKVVEPSFRESVALLDLP